MSRVELPDDLSELLGPKFPTWRENQKETVENLLEAFDTNDVVLVEAPTGTGKTILGAATARALSGSAVYLAHTIMLQEQQLHTLPEAVTVTGRGNHPCLLPVAQELGLTAEDADCPCQTYARPGGCSYYSQWFDALESRDVVLNYAYIVRVAKARGIKVADGFGNVGERQNIISNPFVGRKLMVCDEGHNLESALLAADAVEVYESAFDRYGYRVPRTVEFGAWPVWATDIGPDLESRITAAGAGTEQALAEGNVNIGTDSFKELKRLKNLMQTVDNIKELAGTRAENPDIFVARKPHGYTLQPLWAWNRARKLLFRHAERTMIMSATLGTPGLLAKLLGLEHWEHLKVPSTFPVKNRPVYYWPVSKMNRNSTEEDYVKQALALINLANKFPNSPGLIHCNSYSLGKRLAEIVLAYDSATYARLVLHDAKDRAATFKKWELTDGYQDKILITPAATTGVDWDFVGWQQICKVPYPDLGDDIVRLRYEYTDADGREIGKEVYTQEAVKTLVQAAGRNVRTPTSKGVTVVTDAAFWALFKHIAPDAFPDWFRAAVQWYEPKGSK